MDMTGERLIPAPRQRVWDALNDPAILKDCIPGCESLEKTGENELRATAGIKLGPINARFTGKVQLSDLDPPSSYRISGEGQGGVAGFAKGGANVSLADQGSDTLLTYVVNAQVGGKIAQLGARLIDATSKQMADLFFDRFSAKLAPAEDMGPDARAGQVMVDDTPAAVMTDGPIGAIAAMTGSAESARRPTGASAVPAGPPKLSILDLIPAEPFGLPRVATIGIVLWLIVFFLVFKTYVGL
ncbi:MAG: carbon monoxide dehydrogenase subunit G [Acetobacteraceae bacterium]|nr:carbon monoxide dehydrogenase subunit G [Acetobacteraceae bacterium]